MPRSPRRRSGSTTRTSPVLLLCLAGLLPALYSNQSEAALQRGPWLQNVTRDSIRLLYMGDGEDGDGQVEYGTTTAYGLSTRAVRRWSVDSFYIARLNGLSPGTRYFYRLTHAGSLKEGSFLTAPQPGESFNFAVVGDTRSGHATHQGLIQGILEQGYPDLLLHTGDLVADGARDEDWQTFFDIEEPLLRNTVLCPVFGNHEQGEIDNPTRYGLHFVSGDQSRFWYAFSYGNAYFLAVNTEAYLWGNQGEFVDRQLRRARENPDIDFIFVLFHAPGVTTSASHAPNAFVLLNLLDKFEEFNVDAVFTGHNHCYEHGIVNGVHHLVSGGGGAGLYSLIEPYEPLGWELVYRESVNHYLTVQVRDESYTMESRYPDGTLFDSYTATRADGGYPGPTPPDLLARAVDLGCGGCAARLPGARVEDVEAAGALPGARTPSCPLVHLALNGLLYGCPALLVLGLRRRIRRS